MKKPVLLQDVLKNKYRCSPKYFFRFKEQSFFSMAQQVLEINDAYQNSLPFPSYVEAIKQENRRYVFRVRCEAPVVGLSSYILKFFPFRAIRHSFQYYWKRHTQSRFGFGEAKSLIIASSRGLNVPDVYGYACLKGLFNQIKTDMVMMQDLDHHTPVGELLQSNCKDQQFCKEQILRRVIPLFAKLYQTSGNNIDMNLGAILLDDDGCDDYILDFEYSKFHKKSNLEITMSNAGHFADRCRNYLTEETIDWFIAELLKKIHINDVAVKEQLRSRFYYYFNTKLSRKERMEIG